MFGGVIYINLARRPDRRAQIEAELAEMGLAGERFETVEGAPGIVGCMKSHTAVLRLARARGWTSVLVLEDDFAFRVDRAEFAERVGGFLASGRAFDVLMLGYNAPAGGLAPVRALAGAGQEPDPAVLRVLAASTASCYLVRGGYLPSLIALYEWALPRLERTGEHWVYANDQVWGALQRRDRWLCLAPRLGAQRAGWSDNAGEHTDYGV